MNYRSLLLPLLLALLVCLFMAACTPSQSLKTQLLERTEDKPTDLESIKHRGHIIVATRLDGVGCYYRQEELVGYECRLLNGFADHLGVSLQVKKRATIDEIFTALNEDLADIGAAGLTQTTAREQRVRFSIPLFATREVLVQRTDQPVKHIAELAGKTVSLRKSSAYVSELQRAAHQVGLRIGPQATATTIGVEFVDEKRATLALIADVAEHQIDFTVADQHIAENANVDDFNLDTSLVFGQPRNIGLTVRKHGDGSLLKALNSWLNSEPAQAIRRQATRQTVAQKTPELMEDDQTAPTAAATSKASQLPLTPWDDLYQRYATAPLDWQWLAAQSYVESRFYPDATSPAGAMGLMQLMPNTAKELRIPASEFFDLSLNVRGGAMYVQRMYQHWNKKGLPLRDAIAFAFASYNAGLGHALDARTLARTDGADPNQWFSNKHQRGVEDYITELEYQPVYQRADIKYGYCRGSEPKNYVRRIFKKRQQYADLSGKPVPFSLTLSAQ